jgi:hypothetical protein
MKRLITRAFVALTLSAAVFALSLSSPRPVAACGTGGGCSGGIGILSIGTSTLLR